MFELLAFPFFQRALLIGLILGALMAILGVIVVLRNMSFFADAIGHAALTGIAIGLLLQINPFTSALIYTLLVAAGIAIIRTKAKLPLDTLLGVFFAASVALGVILVQLTPGYQANLLSFLFGDILTVSTTDLVLTIAITAATNLALIFAGKSFIAIAFDQELAHAEGVSVATHELILLIIIAAVIALAVKIVGVILVTAMLIIPAATALNLARSLTTMFTTSLATSLLSVTLGMLTSATLNLASGPTIVLTATLLFTASLIARPLVKTL